MITQPDARKAGLCRHYGSVVALAIAAIVMPAQAATLACNASALPTLAAMVDPALGVTLSSATPGATVAGDYCRVAGVIGPSPSTIGFAVGLPMNNWNGRFLMSGDGGFDGTASLPLNRLAQGYVVANSDSGHVTPPSNDAIWAFNNRTTEVDYGYRAVQVTTQVAKQIARGFFKGKAIEYAYFEGCSTGGRQAMMASQRYPEEFDGIVGGAPAFDLTGLAVEQNWSLQKFRGAGSISGKSSNLFKAVMAKCDAVDGLTDGLIEDPRACHFDPAVDFPACAPGTDLATCLTPAQASALADVYDGPQTSRGKGKSLYPGKPLGSESWWNLWLLPDLTGTPAQGGFTFSFMNYLFFKNDPGPGYNWFDFNFDKDPQKAGTMSKILDALDPKLKDMQRQGGKLILYHGAADGLITPLRTIEYYEEVMDKNPARHGRGRSDSDGGAMSFARLFMVPGMDHCGAVGGGLKDWDRLAPLVNWVENGVAPDTIIASQNLSGGLTRTRPLCPYPSQAQWNGSGSSDDAANFACVMPATDKKGKAHHKREHSKDD